MIGFFDVLPVYLLMGAAIIMMIYEAFFDKISFVKLKNFKINIFPLLLLFIQPIFMASNLTVARGGRICSSHFTPFGDARVFLLLLFIM